jgi:hypothetical protein
MADDFEDQGWVKLGVSAALEAEYLRDQKTFVELLAKTLSSTLPNETEIQTRGLFKKSIVGITVMFDNNRYMIQLPEHGPVYAGRTHIVRGIALKTEPITVEQCLQEISAAIESRAAQSGSARTALANMLGLE